MGFINIRAGNVSAHLDNDPLRRTSESIARRIAAALEGKHDTSVPRVRWVS
jgi:hypothetical protein